MMDFMGNRRTFLRALGATAWAAALPAIAQEWVPTRPVRLVVPFAPGGQPDLVARALGEPLGRALGVPVVVENRPGAGGNIAADAVAKAPPDGLTLLVGTNGPLAVSPALDRNLPYDPLRDFAPVTLVGTSPNLVAVHPSVGVATLQELVAKARVEPGALNFASVGRGSISQLSMELLAQRAGVRLVHVPYNGGAPAVLALVAGDVQVLSLNPTALIPQMRAGKVRILAQTSARRSPLIPSIPTVAESGWPGFEADVWIAIVAPAKTPAAAIARLHRELARIVADPALKSALWDPQWIDPVGGTPAEAREAMRREAAKWAAIVQSAHLDLAS